MPPRSPGRPKAADPRDVKLTFRLTEREADLLQRLAKTDTLSHAIRLAITAYITTHGGAHHLPDTPQALIRREMRKAKRAGQTEDATLVETFEMAEPAAAAPVPSASAGNVGTFTPVPWDGPTELYVTLTPVPSEPLGVRGTFVPVRETQAPAPQTDE
jgi:hypothetical protein